MKRFSTAYTMIPLTEKDAEKLAPNGENSGFDARCYTVIGTAMDKRICFCLQVKKHRLEEYRARHASVNNGGSMSLPLLRRLSIRFD